MALSSVNSSFIRRLDNVVKRVDTTYVGNLESKFADVNIKSIMKNATEIHISVTVPKLR